MTRTLEDWRPILRDLDPMRILSPAELADHYVRPDNATSDTILNAFDESTDPASVRYLVAGARGSGKTTELLRVFAQTSGAGQLRPVTPIYVDLAPVLPERADTRTWIPLIAAALHAEHQAWKPTLPTSSLPAGPRSLSSERWKRLLEFIPSITRSIKVLLPDAGTFADALEALRALTRDIAQEPSDNESLDSQLRSMREDAEGIREASGRPPALLLDGFDKRTTVDGVLEALNEADVLLQLPVAMVLSGPMELSLDPRFAAHLIPGRFRDLVQHNLPVVTPSGDPDPRGVGILRSLFERRWEAHTRSGPVVLPPHLVEEAARWSSGIVREFLAIVHLAAQKTRRAALDQATPTQLAEAVQDRRRDYERAISSDLWDELAKILRTRERPRANVDELLYTNRIACYPNGGVWFRPHELLIPHLQDRAVTRAAP